MHPDLHIHPFTFGHKGIHTISVKKDDQISFLVLHYGLICVYKTKPYHLKPSRGVV